VPDLQSCTRSRCYFCLVSCPFFPAEPVLISRGWRICRIVRAGQKGARKLRATFSGRFFLSTIEIVKCTQYQGKTGGMIRGEMAETLSSGSLAKGALSSYHISSPYVFIVDVEHASLSCPSRHQARTIRHAPWDRVIGEVPPPFPPWEGWCHADLSGSGFAFGCITPLMNGWQLTCHWMVNGSHCQRSGFPSMSLAGCVPGLRT